MNQTFIKRWERRKDEVRAAFEEKLPEEYKDIVTAVVRALRDEDDDGDEYDYGTDLNTERITEVRYGDYDGTLTYVIGSGTYGGGRVWCVTIDYGSCSGCDALERISCYYDNEGKAKAVNDLMTLALHIVQGLKESVDADEDIT